MERGLHVVRGVGAVHDVKPVHVDDGADDVVLLLRKVIGKVAHRACRLLERQAEGFLRGVLNYVVMNADRGIRCFADDKRQGTHSERKEKLPDDLAAGFLPGKMHQGA